MMNRLLPAILALHFLTISLVAQGADQWLRVQTDDGTFSVEVPTDHKYLYSEQGFIISRDQRDFLTSKMSMLTSFTEGTLLSLEVYDAIPAALDAIFEKDNIDSWKRADDERIGKTKVRTIKRGEPDAFAVAKYFEANGKIFILLAAARDGNNAKIDRFFSSIDVKAKGAPFRTGTTFSKLKRSDLTMRETDPPARATPTQTPSVKPTPDPNVRKFVLLRRFSSSYVPKARTERVSGNITLRVYFAHDGFIPHIDVYKKLSGGLLRQTLYAAARMRYLPEEKDGKPVTISRPVTYSFRIY